MAKRTVRTQRRRRSETPSGGRQRAEAPRRQRPSSSPSGSSSGGPSFGGGQSSGGSSGGGYIPSSGGGFPLGGGGGGMSGSTMLIIGVIIALVICGFLAFNLLGGGGGDGGGIFEEQAPPSGQTGGLEDSPLLEGDEGGLLDGGAAEEEEAAVAEPFTPPPVSADGDTWLVMLYQDADDKILEQDIYLDLNEAERIGSSDRVQIVAQVDRYQGGYQGDGNWSGTRRYYVTPDPALNQLDSQLIEDLGEVNMADGQTLVDFVTWAMETFEADKHVLIMSDHGMGWPGGWTDPTAPNRGADNVALAQNGDMLFLMELDRALAAIREQTGLEKFELIGLDACLMAHAEVNSALAPHARYAVASQEVEPALGWAYAGFLNELAANPNMSGAELGRLIVDSYIREDQRIVDNQARAEFAGAGASLGSLFGLGGSVPSAAQLTQQLERNITLSVVDLEANGLLTESLNNFAFALQDDNQRLIAEARTYAQPFTSIFGSNVPASYIDLAHFAQLIANNSQNQAVVQAANELIGVIDQVVVAEKHGANKAGANGISVYFPNSQLYGTAVAGSDSYTTIANRFASESLWDDFLTFHYTGRLFGRGDTAVAVPDRGVELEGPGSGDISISPLSISDNSVALGETILLSADLEGESIGYVYFFAGFLDEAANSIFVADTDYLDSGDTREIQGVYYPEWGEGEFTLEFEWEPFIFGINDGTTVVPALFQPETYGAAAEDAIYTVEGNYTYADGETRRGRLYFSNEDGMLVQVYGYTGESEEALGAPWEIVPSPGDSFTVLEQWMDLDESGAVASIEMQEGGTVTFGDVPFTWEELDAAAGTYIVGFIIEDLDGKRFPVYEQVVVE